MSDGSWRCANNQWRFCPPEGCPRSYGCARKKGWKLGDPSPIECSGQQPVRRQDILSERAEMGHA